MKAFFFFLKTLARTKTIMNLAYNGFTMEKKFFFKDNIHQLIGEQYQLLTLGKLRLINKESERRDVSCVFVKLETTTKKIGNVCTRHTRDS